MPKTLSQQKQATARWYLFLGSFLTVCYLVGCGSGGPTSGNSNSSTSTGGGGQSGNIATSTTVPEAPKAEEADLYRKKGDYLYYLHAYKGLTIFSMNDAEKPKVLSTLPVFGYPIEMYVGESIAYVMVRQAVSMAQTGGSHSYKITKTPTQLISIDISDPSKPKLLHRVTVNGSLDPGQSRKVGNLIYMVTYHPEESVLLSKEFGTTQKGQLYLHKFSVANPSQMKMVLRIPIRSSIQAQVLAPGSNIFVKLSTSGRSGILGDPELRADRLLLHQLTPTRFLGAVMTASSKRLIITTNNEYRAGFAIQPLPPGQNASTNRGFGGFGSCGGSRQNLMAPVQFSPNMLTALLNYTTVRVYDISEESGQLTLRRSFRVQGYMSDQFKQKIVDDGNKEDALYLGILRRNALQISASRVTSEVKNLFMSIDLGTNRPTLRNMMAFGKPDETVRASLFDHKRQVVYAITASGKDEQDKSTDRVDITRERQRPRTEPLIGWDPLYALSYKNPDKLQSLSDIDELSGDINLFRLIEGGQFLLAVGRDTSESCSGFDKDTGLFSRTAVSIIDVRDLTKIKLVQRRCITIKPSVSVVSSDVNWDRDQAHKYIGIHESNDLNIVAVPVQYTDPNTSKNHTTVSLMRWDIKRYKDHLPNTSQTVLSGMGTLEHSEEHGALQRMLFHQNSSTPKAPVLVTLAQERLNVASLSDLTQPKPLTSLTIAPEVKTVYRVGDYLVSQIQADTTPNTTLGPDWVMRVNHISSPFEGSTLSRFTIKQVQSIISWNQSLLVFRGRSTLQTELQVIDLKDPKQPKFLKPSSWKSYVPKFAHQLSIQGNSNLAGQAWIKTPHGLLFIHRESSDAKIYLSFLDLRDPSQPKLSKLTELADKTRQLYLLKVDENQVVLVMDNALTEQGQPKLQHWTWNKDQWVGGEKLNIDGYCIKVIKKNGQWMYVSTQGTTTRYTGLTLYKRTQENTLQLVSRLNLALDASQVITHDDLVSIHSNQTGLKVYRITDQHLVPYKALPLRYSYGILNEPTKLVLEQAHGPYLQYRVEATGGILWLKIEDTTGVSDIKSLFFAPNFNWDIGTKKTGQISMIPQTTQHVVISGDSAFVANGKFGVLRFDLNHTNILQQ